MTLEHATHTTYKITRFDSEEWLNYNKKERSKPLKNEPNCLKPGRAPLMIILIRAGGLLQSPGMEVVTLQHEALYPVNSNKGDGKYYILRLTRISNFSILFVVR